MTGSPVSSPISPISPAGAGWARRARHVGAGFGSNLANYRRLISARIRSDWQYRASFLMFLLGQALVAGFDLAVILVLFSQITSLAGWTQDEAILLYSMAGISFGLADLFVSPVESASVHIKAGTFDQFLIRPIGVLWQLSAHDFAPRRVGRTIVPLVFLPIALSHVTIDWTVVDVVLVPVSLIAGTAIFGAIWVATSALVFWTVDSQGFTNSFTYGGNLLTQYPLRVMAPWLQRVAVFVVPLAFVAYFPCAYLLGKDRPSGLPSWMTTGLAFASPFVAAVAIVVARSIWRQALRHYRSTGS
jgi:ABC-2 type transport system permease protein